MTIRQEAYSLIDSLPEDSVHAIVEIMIRMIPVKRQQSESIRNTTAVHARDVSAKMKAFMKMQELRKEMAQYDISDKDREIALEEKYGTIVWGGNA